MNIVDQNAKFDFIAVGYEDAEVSIELAIESSEGVRIVSPRKFEKIYHPELTEFLYRYALVRGDFLSERRLLDNQIGWIADGYLQSYIHAAVHSLKYGCVVAIVAAHVKDAIQDAELSGAYFQPIWVNQIRNIAQPDYFMLTTTNWIDDSITLKRDVMLGPPFDYTYPKKIIPQAKDFNAFRWPPHREHENFDIAPSFISKRAYDILKSVKGFKFFPIEWMDT